MNIYQRRHQKRKGIAMKKKKVLSILLAAVMATAMMAGCGGKEEDTSKGEKKETENKTVSIMGWYDEDDMEGVINAVNEQLDGDVYKRQLIRDSMRILRSYKREMLFLP